MPVISSANNSQAPQQVERVARALVWSAFVGNLLVLAEQKMSAHYTTFISFGTQLSDYRPWLFLRLTQSISRKDSYNGCLSLSSSYSSLSTTSQRAMDIVSSDKIISIKENDNKYEDAITLASPSAPFLKFGVNAILAGDNNRKLTTNDCAVRDSTLHAGSPGMSINACTSLPALTIQSTSVMCPFPTYELKNSSYCLRYPIVCGGSSHPVRKQPYFHGPALIPVPGSLAFLGTMRGKPTSGVLRRAVFSDIQRKGLERMFQRQHYICKPDRKELATKLGLKDSQVKIWFQNRRMKWRNSKEREFLCCGGAKESTSPTDRTSLNPNNRYIRETDGATFQMEGCSSYENHYPVPLCASSRAFSSSIKSNQQSIFHKQEVENNADTDEEITVL